MAGLTISGFEVDTYDNIKSRIETKLDAFNSGFDFSAESPDGQLIGVMTYEIYLLWTQLNEVYNSYNPAVATGAALKNIGKLTGISYENAGRAYATCETTGTTGTIIPAGSVVAFGDYEFYTSFEVAVPSNVQVVASVAGVLDIPANSIDTIVTQGISGWDSVAQSTDGISGTAALTEQQYRNLRASTVMRNHTDTVSSMEARLVEAGAAQATVFNNDTTSAIGSVPANTIHVTVGELGAITTTEIAQVILDSIPLGCPTYGTTTIAVADSQGVSHNISFSLATEVAIEIVVDVTYLDENTGGADDSIKASLTGHINSLLSGEDVIWSRLFGYITPYSKAQVNTLTIAKSGDTQGIANLSISDSEYASLATADITFTVT